MNAEILFINLPPYESYYAENVPHLGMLYVMTSLREHGYTVGYLDCARRGTRLGQVLERIREASPRLIGFSVDTDNLFSVAHLTKRLKVEFGPELKIIIGGPASQGQADEIMARCAADVLVVGEGEYSACEVADCLLRGKGLLNKIGGICFRTPEGVVQNFARPPISDLDALSFPDRRFLPDQEAYNATMITGRGCPFKCTFCFEGRMGNRYRHRSPENIVAEMEQLLNGRGRLFISFNDDTFTSEPEQTMEVCRLIRERLRPGRDLMWFCEVRVDIVNRHPELVEAMALAGLGRIQIGVESADPEVLRAYKRLNVQPPVVEKVVRAFHEAGVPSIYCGFIIGGPRETMRTMERTLEFAKHLLVDVAPGSFECNASFLTPLPGTEIHARPEEYGLRLLDRELLTSSNFNYCTAETEALACETINNFRYRFVDEFDLEMRKLIPQLSRQVIATHARLFNFFNISTAYWERFIYFPRLSEYLRLVGEGGFEPAEELADAELMVRFPTRLSAPIKMEAGRVTIPKGPTVLTLNGLGSQIYGLCSGKLTVGQIIEELTGRLDGAAPPQDELRADVTKFIRHLDNNYAIFLKDC